jgi:uncharacterized protein (DUF362 family)
VAKYQNSAADCTRDFDVIDHDDPEALSRWITDIYSLNPADFAVMDGLRGMANGPEPSWGGGDYAVDAKDMRLIMASRDAVALDTVEALVMGCDPAAIPYLYMAADAGFGTDDASEITVRGKSIEDVKLPLEGSYACPGK